MIFMPTFNSTAELESYILKRIPKAIEIVTEKIRQVIEECLSNYYGEYDPRVYQRTNQLMNSVKVEVNGCSGSVYIDSSGWHHILDQWSESDILYDAMLTGSHGGASSGTPVWTTSMSQLGDIYALLKDALIAAGIPVK